MKKKNDGRDDRKEVKIRLNYGNQSGLPILENFGGGLLSFFP